MTQADPVSLYDKQALIHRVSTLTAGGDLSLTATQEDLLLQAAKLTGANVSLTSEQGRIILQAVKDRVIEAKSKSSGSQFWTYDLSKGHDDETVRMVEIHSDGTVSIDGATGLSVDDRAFPEGTPGGLVDQIAQLSQAPGLEWMAQVRQMPGVD
ncbi:hemagglutinin repeat-containing protein [Rhodospirillum sp. A1_3_36]|uniref:hemagglutinin repeat-containing protein n=1 Tax=Rhodospirillum sp. A1_3_36 TaxID=3391666 RepID=UPI0039A6B209